MIPKKIYIDSKYFNAAHIDANKGMPDRLCVGYTKKDGSITYVALKEIWHDARVIPMGADKRIVFYDDRGIFLSCQVKETEPWESFAESNAVIGWAYMADLIDCTGIRRKNY